MLVGIDEADDDDDDDDDDLALEPYKSAPKATSDSDSDSVL